MNATRMIITKWIAAILAIIFYGGVIAFFLFYRDVSDAYRAHFIDLQSEYWAPDLVIDMASGDVISADNPGDFFGRGWHAPEQGVRRTKKEREARWPPREHAVIRVRPEGGADTGSRWRLVLHGDLAAETSLTLSVNEKRVGDIAPEAPRGAPRDAMEFCFTVQRGDARWLRLDLVLDNPNRKTVPGMTLRSFMLERDGACAS